MASFPTFPFPWVSRSTPYTLSFVTCGSSTSACFFYPTLRSNHVRLRSSVVFLSSLVLPCGTMFSHQRTFILILFFFGLASLSFIEEAVRAGLMKFHREVVPFNSDSSCWVGRGLDCRCSLDYSLRDAVICPCSRVSAIIDDAILAFTSIFKTICMTSLCASLSVCEGRFGQALV